MLAKEAASAKGHISLKGNQLTRASCTVPAHVAEVTGAGLDHNGQLPHAPKNPPHHAVCALVAELYRQWRFVRHSLRSPPQHLVTSSISYFASCRNPSSPVCYARGARGAGTQTLDLMGGKNEGGGKGELKQNLLEILLQNTLCQLSTDS